MKAGNRSYQAEAQTVAGGAATAFQPVEALEDLLTFVSGNSRPVIGNRNGGTAIVSPDLHRYPTGFTAMLDRIVDEIGHGVEQQISVARYEYGLICRHIEASAFFFRRSIEQLHDLSGYVGEIDGAERGGSIIRLDLGDACERRKHTQD